MNLTDFQKKLIWGAGILSIICLWIAFPFIFKLLIEAYKFPEDFKDLGPFGDIYGSLNTLISSIALCAVAFSTWLQVTSLKETREVNAKQLTLAKQAHDEQVEESRNAIFANKFYSLLNFKADKLNSISVQRKIPLGSNQVRNVQETGIEAIEEISLKFYRLLKENPSVYSKLAIDETFKEFQAIVENLGYKSVATLISYFHIYMDLCQLIKFSHISDQEKKFYKSVLSNSMTQGEQILLFWISPMFISLELNDSEIFTMFACNDAFMDYGKTFHNASRFKHDDWKEEFPMSENPT